MMKKKHNLWLSALLLSALLLSSCQTDADTAGSQSSADTSAENTAVLSEVIGTTSGYFEPESFDSIVLSAQSPDLVIRQGEGFFVRYHLHDNEPVKTAEIRDGTLYFETGIDWIPNVDFGDFELEITVPGRDSLKNIQMTTAAGDISLENLEFSGGILKSISGDLELVNLTCTTLGTETVSDEIELISCDIGTLTAKSTSDDIKADGTFGTVMLSTVSGDCELTGSVRESASVDTVSGKISVEAPFSSITADSIGGIQVNGDRQGKSYQISAAEPSLTAKSVSGSIRIQSK